MEKDLIAELPLIVDWPPMNLRRYHDFYIPELFLPGVIAMEQSFQARPDDILICSFPKSGTTWLKALAYAAINRPHQPLDDRHPLLGRNPHDCVPLVEMFRPGYASDLEALDSPRLLGFHSPYSLLPQSVIKTSGCRIVYVCRDPKDVLVSLWHFLKKVDSLEEPLPFEKAFDMFCKGICSFGPVWEHALEFWQESLRQPEKVLFLKYNEMLDEPAAAVKRLAEFSGCPFSKEEEDDGVIERIVKLCSFENLKELDVNKNEKMELFASKNDAYFRKGEKGGDWRNYLSPEMAKKLDGITEEKLKGSGLSFFNDYLGGA